MSPKLLIELEKDTFRKTVFDDENTLFVLKGKVVFTPSSPMKVNQISLRFRGKLVVTRGFQSTRKTFFEHQWDFFRDCKSSTIFEAKPYTYDFELPMPSDLPESLEADYAKIEYSLKGMVETPLFSSNLRADKVVHIQQASSPFDSLSYNTLAQGTWNDMINYEVSIPTHEFVPGGNIDISFKHVNKSEKCKIVTVRAGLSETTRYNSTDNRRAKEDGMVKRWLKSCECSVVESSIDSSIKLAIPASTKNVHYDASTEYVEITHRLTTRIEVEMDGDLYTILNVLPVRISRKDSFESIDIPEFEQLPSYELVQLDSPPVYMNLGDIAGALMLPTVYPAESTTIALGA
ncbi:hypothetical protein K493DRAFT_406582 [Basidiobolus meristosporus CBS 931.73]|uniref:Arrestin C-terminal-like domain-containing protein n=1 Tax=Basidiobolus meristosporus CBS 931.73 TaxID=1314790 RepID=A0A1Y1YKD8_9FUNG|nr:hypothetical protein K493DRAFT_406582 [Basidiobolus meristosporus CBS 931.73]|eukprot:ORX98490.1 hypothetical protein K493DRAFT_406582 [Basidiobolus meristosporus CBS 931.73]